MKHDVGRFVSTLMTLRQDSIPGRWPAKTKGLAPHKPLLVLSVLDEYVMNPQRSRVVEPTPQLEERFKWYWRAVFGASRRTTIALPFYHIKNDGFWRLIAHPGKEALVDSATRIRKSAAGLREFIQGAEIDIAFYQFISDPRWTGHLRSVLITTYFVPEIHERLLIPAP